MMKPEIVKKMVTPEPPGTTWLRPACAKTTIVTATARSASTWAKRERGGAEVPTPRTTVAVAICLSSPLLVCDLSVMR